MLISRIQFRRLTRLPLAVEIGLVILFKILILSLMWKAFFSTPQTKKMVMPTRQVEQHLLTIRPVPVQSPDPTLPKKVSDDSAR